MGKKLKEKRTKRAVNKTAPIKNNKSMDKQNDKFNFNDEIVIGISVPVDEKKAPKKKQNKKKKKSSNSKNNNSKNIKRKNVPQNIVEEKRIKPKRIFGIIKILSILAIICAGIVFLLLSPEFNIDNINVIGNSTLETQNILNLANIQEGENILSFSKRKVISNIMENPYVEQVKIKRKFPNTIDITVKERKKAFNIQNESEYIYIDNKGYILEISNEKSENPILKGITINEETLKEGNRLMQEDLDKLEEVWKIFDVLSNNDLVSLVTQIDVNNVNDCILIMETEGKTIHLGDTSNLITKVLYAKEVIEREKGLNGEIFVNMDLNNENAFFRESV